MLILVEPKILNEAMISLGDMFLQGSYVVFNLNANIDNPMYQRLFLMPRFGMVDFSSPDFDTMYINTLITDDQYFMEIMRIVLYLKDAVNVFLLYFNNDTVFNPITEVICKLIQQRYGYNYTIADSVEDIYNILSGISQDSTFTTPGVLQLDSDFYRYQYILSRSNPGLFIDEKIDDTSY